MVISIQIGWKFSKLWLFKKYMYQYQHVTTPQPQLCVFLVPHKAEDYKRV